MCHSSSIYRKNNETWEWLVIHKLGALKGTIVISDETKTTIDALTKDELRQEINRKNQSRFQRDNYAYLQTRLAALEEQERAIQRQEDISHKNREFSLNKISTWVAIVASVLSLVIGSGWYQEFQKNQRALAAENERLIVEYLQPISTLLNDNESIFNELSSKPYSEPDWGILESYLIKIRRDGVPKHALMKKRIDTLVRNNETIITLLTKYAAYIQTKTFREEAEKFRDHAIRYSDRWGSLIEVFTANGEFPTNAPVFPKDFPNAVRHEISVRQQLAPNQSLNLIGAKEAPPS